MISHEKAGIRFLLTVLTAWLCLLGWVNPGQSAKMVVDGRGVEELVIECPEDPVVSRIVDDAARLIGEAFHITVQRLTQTSLLRTVIVRDRNTTGTGEVDHTGVERDGFRLTIGPGRLVTIGSRESLGLVYGLWEFLEILGFRFYMPGPYGTVYPAGDVLLDSSTRLSNPATRYREIGRDDWCMTSYRANVNIQSLPCGYGKSVWGVFHTFHMIIPEANNAEAFPDLFARERFRFLGKARGMRQLNMRDHRAVEMVASYLANLSAGGRYDMLTLAPNDGRRFDPLSYDLLAPGDARISKAVVSFYNEVAREYRERGGRTPIRAGAYDIYSAPPEVPGLRLEEPLVPYMAHFDYCQRHPLGSIGCPSGQRFLKALEGWKKKAGTLYVYEYLYKHNWLELPWPVYRIARENVRIFLQNGMIGYRTQFSTSNTFSNLLNYYLTSKALWNPDFDLDAAREEFFRLFYAGVSDRMARCYRILEGEFDRSGMHVAGNARKNYTQVFSGRALREACGLAQEAYTESKDPVVRKRVDMMQTWLRYSLCMWHLLRGEDTERNRREIRNLIRYAEDNAYPVFNVKILRSYERGLIGLEDDKVAVESTK